MFKNPQERAKRISEALKKYFSKNKSPLIGRKRPKEVTNKISLANRGRKFSKETKRKMSVARKGIYIGDKCPAFGKHLSEKTKEKIRNANLGKKLSEETKKKISKSMSGSKTHLWRGGISFIPYTNKWTKELKKGIRKRDKKICQICGELQKKITFPVHHIDYYKKNCNPKNLITLCRSCHSKTNTNREYWINYFKNKLTK